MQNGTDLLPSSPAAAVRPLSCSELNYFLTDPRPPTSAGYQMEAAAVPSPPHPSTSPPITAGGNTAATTSGPGRESGDVVNTGSGRGYQLPQRFRAKREKNRQQQQQQQHHQQQFHGTGNNNNNNKKDPPVAAVAAVAAAAAAAAAGMSREEINLNSLLATARHGLPIPFPATSSPPGYMGVAGGGRGPFNFGGGMGGGGVIMFPTPNGQVITKIGPYKEPLLPSGPPPLLPHHGGLHYSPLAFAHHANVKAAMQAMGMFSPNNRKDHGFKFPPPPMLPETPKSPAYSAADMHKARVHSRSESASHALGQINSRSTPSSTSSSPGGGGSNHDPSLKKLMKDLHRCEVSIVRYQTMLNEHCDAGLRFLRQAFITLHIGLNTREKDIARELQITRQTAGVILQRRHTTACVLRQLAERAGELEETQVHELKKQIKQFVADRKVDEEIGTTSRFIGDPDDLLPHVMTFGKVVNRRHVYTHWEGDPAAAVEKSKHASTRSSTSVFSSPPSSLPTTPSPTHSNEHTTPTATTAVPATKSNREGSNGDPISDDSVFERESPSVEKDSIGSLDLEVNEEVGATNRGGEKREEEKSEVACGEVEEEGFRKESVGDIPDGDSMSVSQCPNRGCGKEGDAPQSSSSSSSATRGVKTAGTHPPATLESSSDSRQESTPSSPPTSSSTASLNSTPAVSGSNSPSVSSGDSPAKPPASTVSVSHNKPRQPFSRKFAAPIVVTHTRRSFPKSLPKNLDPKSTVTLLLSSPSSSSSSTSDKSQQKHGKHGNKNKSFNSRRGQFPSSSSSSSYHPSSSSITTTGAEGDQEETSRDSQPTSSVPSSSLSVRLKGREKERELWRKRFSTSSSSLPSSSRGSSGAGEGGGRQGSMSGEEGGGGGVRVKRSPEEMSAIQSRVRESLKAQGVFLYDPVTGAIPAESLRESVDSGVGKSEPHLSDSLRSSSADLKKKTPTQLRRERKKRQRERERRQKELERRGQEEGGSGGGDKQREGERLTDKTSASTSRTTSPLSSLENSTSSDTPTESVSPSRSLSPPPPPPPPLPPPLSPSDTSNRLGEQGDRPARRGENDNTFPKTGSKSVPAGSQLVSSLSEDGDSLSTKTGTNGEVGAPVTARKVGGSPGLMRSTDSASIEWEMSRQQRRHEGVDVVTPLDSPHQSQTRSTGGPGSSVTGVVNRTSSLPSPSSSSPPLTLTRNGLTHSNHATPTSAHLAQQHLQQQSQQCTSAVICTTPSSGTSASSVNYTNGTTELSSNTPSPSSHQPTSTINPSCTLKKLPATSRQMMCPNKFQQNGNEEGPILIINGHEE